MLTDLPFVCNLQTRKMSNFMSFVDFESEHDMNTIVYDSQKIELSEIEKYLS